MRTKTFSQDTNGLCFTSNTGKDGTSHTLHYLNAKNALEIITSFHCLKVQNEKESSV